MGVSYLAPTEGVNAMSRPAPAAPASNATQRTALPDRVRARQRQVREERELREFMATPDGDEADPEFKERLRGELQALVRRRYSDR